MPAKNFIALIAVITVVPLLTLLWLGWRLVAQDRILEAGERQQRLERAADQVVSALQRSISNSLQHLSSDMDDWPDGAVAVTFRDDRIRVRPRSRVAFLPLVAALPEAPAAVFAEGDRLEYQEHDRIGALRVFRELANSSDPSIRSGALLRLGRNLTNSDEALSAYAQLSSVDTAAIGGVPAGLIGIYARCQLLEREKRAAELRDAASYLAGQFYSGRWSLPSSIYWLYAGDVARWNGVSPPNSRKAEIFGDAVDQLWKERESLPSRIGASGETFAVAWQAAGDSRRALIASQEFVRKHWLPAAEAIAKAQQIAFSLGDSAGTRRKAADTGLPWNISAVSLDATGSDGSFVSRKRLMIAGFLTVIFLALAAGYIIYRAVSRELAAVRMQSDFIAAVSHEFRTPLTTLRQFTTMLQENENLTEERRRLCYDAQARATDRLMGLIESLLDFGRMESGAHRYHFEQRDCSELVHGTVEDFRASSQSAGFDVRFMSSGSAEIDVDAEALGRALRNLLENAVKYSPDHREIEVGLRRSNGDLRIAVRDYGIGIPLHERKKIFTKFQRGEQARTRGIKGTGIGLAMVDEIVKAHEGRVEVESEPGKGSTFTIVLPVKE